MADRNKTEAALSVLRQRGAATATTSPCDGGRPTWRVRAEDRQADTHLYPSALPFTKKKNTTRHA